MIGAGRGTSLRSWAAGCESAIAPASQAPKNSHRRACDLPKNSSPAWQEAEGHVRRPPSSSSRENDIHTTATLLRVVGEHADCIRTAKSAPKGKRRGQGIGTAAGVRASFRQGRLALFDTRERAGSGSAPHPLTDQAAHRATYRVGEVWVVSRAAELGRAGGSRAQRQEWQPRCYFR